MINKPEGDIKQYNFWEYNPNYKLIFDDFYSGDKSKGKSKTSFIMWAYYLILYSKSDFYNLPDKRKLIKDKFLKNPSFKWDDYKEVESLFKESILTQAERSLCEWNEYMRKRDDYLKKQEYYFDYYDKKSKLVRGTAEQLDRAYSTTPKMYSDYEKIQKSLKEDEYKTSRGNKIKSLTDAKEI
jgi:hypothetical protein